MSELFTLTTGIEQLVQEQVAAGGVAMEVANEIAAYAIGAAPVVTGRYRDGIIVQETKRGARVLASDQKSSWIEFGNPKRNQPARFILRNAVEALGYTFKKTRR